MRTVMSADHVSTTDLSPGDSMPAVRVAPYADSLSSSTPCSGRDVSLFPLNAYVIPKVGGATYILVCSQQSLKTTAAQESGHCLLAGFWSSASESGRSLLADLDL